MGSALVKLKDYSEDAELVDFPNFQISKLNVRNGPLVLSLNEKELTEEEIQNVYKNYRKIRIVVVSDTHGLHNLLEIPEGDIFIHCGDYSNWRNSSQGVYEFREWLKKQKFTEKLITAGNHEIAFRLKSPPAIQEIFGDGIKFMQNRKIKIDVNNILEQQESEVPFTPPDKKILVFYGAPWTPSRGLSKMANGFTTSASEIQQHWANIPSDVDVLVTHVPPMHILDKSSENMGCAHLLRSIESNPPLLHLFGHNHSQSAVMGVHKDKESKRYSKTMFVNAASKRGQAKVNPPIVIDVFPYFLSDYGSNVSNNNNNNNGLFEPITEEIISSGGESNDEE